MALISSGPATNGAHWFESPGGYQRLFAFTGSLGHHPLSLGDVLKLRKNARPFREWLQTQADRDRNALLAYHHEVAKRSGFRHGAIKTLKLFGAIGGAVAGGYVKGPVGAAIGGTTGGQVVDAAVRAVDLGVRYVFDLAGKLDEDWKPVVFGDWARDYVQRVQTSSQ
jgi:hypothetical protein